MRHDRLLFVLVPLFLMAVGAPVVKQVWFREDAKPVATEDKAPVAKEDKAPVGKADNATIGNRGFLRTESKWERKHKEVQAD